jgi:hypothetical protein
MTKDSEVHLENCLLMQTYSPSQKLYSLVSLLVRMVASHMGGQWINPPRVTYYFISRHKTSEYSEIYCELLTSEHFPLYNYRSSTLPRISRNISKLLRQCIAADLKSKPSFFYNTVLCEEIGSF